MLCSKKFGVVYIKYMYKYYGVISVKNKVSIVIFEITFLTMLYYFRFSLVKPAKNVLTWAA